MLTIHVDKTKSVKQFAQQTLVAQWGVATVSDQKTKTATSDFVWYTTQLMQLEIVQHGFQYFLLTRTMD